MSRIHFNKFFLFVSSLCVIKWFNVTVTVTHGRGQRSTLWYQRQDADAWGRQRPLGLLIGRWCAGCVWGHPAWRRWLWHAAPLRVGPPSDDRAERASEGGNRQTTCRLWQNPVLNRTSLSANIRRKKWFICTPGQQSAMTKCTGSTNTF